jgi:hypothetical protein
MKAEISSKLAAFAVALMMNALIIVGIANLFNVQAEQQAAGVAASSPTAAGRLHT